jgi:hypothetical protein
MFSPICHNLPCAGATDCRGENRSLRNTCLTAISLSVIRIAVTPVPVAPLLPGAQLNESPPLVMLGLIALVRAVFIAVPSVIVLVAPVVVSLVDFALPAFLVPVTLPIFLVPVVLRAGRGHRRNRCSKGSSQKKRTEIWVSTVHVGLLWREIHIRRIPLTSLSALALQRLVNTARMCLKEALPLVQAVVAAFGLISELPQSRLILSESGVAATDFQASSPDRPLPTLRWGTFCSIQSMLVERASAPTRKQSSQT